jgi:hypothetical protein
MGGIFVNILNSIPIIGGFQGFYPPQWATQPQLVSITAQVPVTNSSTSTTNVQSQILESGFTTPGTTQVSQNNTTTFQTTTYYFDAIFHVDHDQPLTVTRHPIQDGAAISDHAYLEPIRIILDIGISDAMASYVAGQYGGYDSKSAGFYITMRNLQAQRLPLTLTTRLSTYENMVIQDIRAHEDVKTRYAFRGTMTLQQVFMAQVDNSPVPSARPNQTAQNNPGSPGTTPVPQNLQAYQDPVTGDWSSNLP